MNNTANRTRPMVINAGMAVPTKLLQIALSDRSIMGDWLQLFKRSNRSGAHRVGSGLTEQARLLTPCALLRFHGGDRRHVENTARGHGGRQDVRRPRRSDQYRSDRQGIG